MKRHWNILERVFSFVGKQLLHIVEKTFFVANVEIVLHSV